MPERWKRRGAEGKVALAHAQEEEVREYWSYCGEIESLSLMRFPDTNRFKGIAFITFATVSSTARSLLCDLLLRCLPRLLLRDRPRLRVPCATDASVKA